MRVVVVAGTHSGVGKTTIASALMLAYARRGLRVRAFKVGADFVDPMVHRVALRQSAGESENLDGYMMTAEYNAQSVAKCADECDVAIVDGVMGLYDGRDGMSEDGSTAQMAKWLNAGVLLVVDCNAMARSVAAVIKGYREFDAELNLIGVVFNKTGGEAHTQYLRESLQASDASVSVFGGIPKDATGAAMGTDGGATMSGNDDAMEQRISHMAMLLEQNVDLDVLLKSMPEFHVSSPMKQTLATDREDRTKEASRSSQASVRIAVARDEAFCFYYPENLLKLQEAGAELVYFSPIAGDGLPHDIQGVIFGGGYPEFHAQALLKNRPLRSAVTALATAGGVVYAECGGLMFLSQSISAPDGSSPRSMCGIAPFATRLSSAVKTSYAEVTIAPGNPLFKAGEVVRGQTFRYSEIHGDRPTRMRVTEDKVAIGWGATYEVKSEQKFNKTSEVELDGFAWNNVLASQVHLHFGANPSLATSFVEACRKVTPSASEAAQRAAMVSRRTMSKSFGPLTPNAVTPRSFEAVMRTKSEEELASVSAHSDSPEKVKQVLPPRRARAPSRDFREFSIDLDSAEGIGMIRSRSSASMSTLASHINKLPGMPRKPSQTELDQAINLYFGSPAVLKDHLHAANQLQLPLPQSVGPIISLSTTATAILFALGVGERIVGITDACTVPEEEKVNPKVVARHKKGLGSPQSSSNLGAHHKRSSSSLMSEFEQFGGFGGSSAHSASFGSLARASAKEKESSNPNDKWASFDVNFVRHAEARLIFTPDVCAECTDVRTSTAKYLHEADVFLTSAEFESDEEMLGIDAAKPSIFPIAPQTLSDVLEVILQIGILCGEKEKAITLLTQLRSRLRTIARVVADADERPKVLSLEGIKPFVAGGHWLHEMKSIAGGIDEVQEPGVAADRLRWEQVLTYAPEVLILSPCYVGKSTEETMEKTFDQLEYLASQPGWWVIPAVQSRRVYILTHEFTCEAGPQLVDGVEALARIFHPDLFPMELRQGICYKFNLEEGKTCRPKQVQNHFTEWR